jgi:hypothetical protein
MPTSILQWRPKQFILCRVRGTWEQKPHLLQNILSRVALGSMEMDITNQIVYSLINWKTGAMVTQRFAKPYIIIGVWVRLPRLPPNLEGAAGLAGNWC